MLFVPSDDEVGGFQARLAGVVELVDTQDLGSCAFGCEGSSPSFGTVFNWLRANSTAASIRLVRRV